MAVLGHDQITIALKEEDSSQRLFITPLLDHTQIGDASVDVRLGNDFLATKRGNIGVLDPNNREDSPNRFRYRHRLNRREPFYLHPNEVVLASTLEFFRLPDSISAYVTSRSKWGRVGLVIATATAIHPGFTGTVTLELVNHSNVPLVLYPGLLVAQVIFSFCDGASEYKGDLAGKTDTHVADMTKGWQQDMAFWCPSIDKTS
ncbi:MAG: dCTP deaminase [Candidatus Thiodiazotropha endolucinida]